MKALNYNSARFIKSVHDLNQLPPDVGAEVAFAGASNSGKSSAINAITGIGRLAKTSKTPGRTQLINFFELDNKRRLVDLPGYGYAKVPQEIKQHWQRVVSEYISHRGSLTGIVLIMDIRHPLKPLDWQMIEWATSQAIPLHILLSKADKLKRGATQKILFSLKKELSGYETYLSWQLFSAFSREGVDQARSQLDVWLNLD